VFIGSTNADAYLDDETGGRRFWPVKVGAIDIAKLTDDREQLWAEAVAAYRAAEIWWLPKDIEQAAREEQENRQIGDPWETRVMEYAELQGYASIPTILEKSLELPPAQQDRAAQNRVARILKGNKWERKQLRVNGSRTWLYYPPQAGVTITGQANGDADGDGKPSISASVTIVTNVTIKNHAHMRESDTGGPAFFSQPLKNSNSNGDNGDTHAKCERSAEKYNYWKGEVERARHDTEQLTNVACRWLEDLGGQRTGEGAWTLPCLPKCEELQHAKMLALNLKVLLNETPYLDMNDAGPQVVH
jgi:hypothetical protein